MVPPLWPCNKMLKPNFQSIISQTDNGCSLFSLVLAKVLLLDIKLRKYFCIIRSDCMPLFDKKCAKMSVFFNVKTVKIRSGGWEFQS